MQFVASEQAQQIDAHQVVSDLGTSVASHPIDTHPTLAARAEALSVNLYAACTVAVDELKEHHLQELVEDPLAAIEEEASMVEHRFSVAAGQVVLPKPSGEAESAQPE